MRCLIASLAVAGLAAHALAHDSAGGHVRRRKTLAFGPHNPSAVFDTHPPQLGQFVPHSPDADPYAVARDFADELTGRRYVDDSKSYYVRKDSYTDKNTGVTHVYMRQLVHGIEVADGDLNINVKDGVVISYGNSFYNGEAPGAMIWKGYADELPHTHIEYCRQLEDEYLMLEASFDEQFESLEVDSSEQTILNRRSSDRRREFLGPTRHLLDSNCAGVGFPYDAAISRSSEFSLDPREPLLLFMLSATPNDEVVGDILERFDEHLANMSSHVDTTFVDSEREVRTEVIQNVPDTMSPVKARIAFVQVPDEWSTVLKLVWKYEIEMQDNSYEAAVSATQPHRIISVVDWVSDSPIPVPEPEEPTVGQYNVFSWGKNDPSVGNRSLELENYDAQASPAGWHAIPFQHDPSFRGIKKKGEFWRNSTKTWGNNVFAHEDWEGRNNWVDNYRPDAGGDLVFAYSYEPKKTDKDDALDEAKKYINATVTQLFYTSNLVHDLFYRYGFDEVSGNFQQYNFERGGEENDAVIANAQDGSGFNNANFMTPPDGQNGRCRMYLWNTANPYRDGDLEAGIVIHELSHGLSTRLTGGPANSGCLGWGESGGMGEGWGDFLATTIRSNRNYSDYPMGAWAANRDNGIRLYPYSLNLTVNPSTYKILDKPGYWGVHAIGEVWAEILWVVSNRLISKYGFVDTLYPPLEGEDKDGDDSFYLPKEYDSQGKEKPQVPRHGNSLIVQLVLNGMKLQQCRPSFFDARDAIIQADQVLTGGQNFCELWAGFAARGLGPDARVEGRTPWGGGIRTNDFVVPLACRAEEPVPEDPEDPEPEDWNN